MDLVNSTKLSTKDCYSGKIYLYHNPFSTKSTITHLLTPLTPTLPHSSLNLSFPSKSQCYVNTLLLEISTTIIKIIFWIFIDFRLEISVFFLKAHPLAYVIPLRISIFSSWSRCEVWRLRVHLTLLYFIRISLSIPKTFFYSLGVSAEPYG